MPEILGAELLHTLMQLPDQSGVYHYFDSKGKLLYIGKAKNLKNRIKSYFRFTPALSPAPNLSPRVHRMIAQTASLSYILTQNENDALILENSLIKQLKPKYNILLRDDKTYPYIFVDTSEDFPRLKITRKVQKSPTKSVHYFGPFCSGASEILDCIYEGLALVQSDSCLRGKKACLFHQIHRCLAPCEGKITSSEYQKILKEALEWVNNPKKIIHFLKQKIATLSEQLRFEEAMVLRDRIVKLEKIAPYSLVDLANLQDLDIFAIYVPNANTQAQSIEETQERESVLVKLFMRQGKIISSAHILLKNEEGFDLQEAYRRSIMNAYSSEIPILPKSIICAHPLEHKAEIESYLMQTCGKKIPLTVAKQGDKRRLVELALQNGKEIYHQEKQKQQENSDKNILKELSELFNIQTPFRIEAFDTSHLQGQECVGAMIVYEEGFVKSSYRRYKLSGSDEYSQMREMLLRRAESFSEESPPDLWLLDGGSAQINLATQILSQIGANVDVLGIAKEKLDAKAHRAKGGALDIIRSKSEEFRLQKSDKRLQFLQKIRDEVHRFAITYHRQTHIKAQMQSKLLESSGIGKSRLKKLLDYFGSFEAIQKATQEELEIILPQNLAQSLREFLQKSNS